MGDHEIMRSMAVDYRRAAEDSADPDRRHRLAGLAEYCHKMALAMEQMGSKGDVGSPLERSRGKPAD